MAEYGAPVSDTQTWYPMTDHLGSTRMVTSSQATWYHDYLPFGEEIDSTACSVWSSNPTCGRGLSYGGPDNPRQKFTGKERDSETGLDWFGARYFSSAQGRFTTDRKSVV